MDDYMDVGPAITTPAVSVVNEDCSHTLDNPTSRNDVAPEHLNNDGVDGSGVVHHFEIEGIVEKQPCSRCSKVTTGITTLLIVIVVVVISVMISRGRTTPSGKSPWSDPGAFSAIPTHAECVPASKSADDECTAQEDCGIVCGSRSGWGDYYPICHCGTAYTPTRYYNSFYCPERSITTPPSTSATSSTESSHSSYDSSSTPEMIDASSTPISLTSGLTTATDTSPTLQTTTPTRNYEPYVEHAKCCCEMENAEIMAGRPFIVNRVSRTAQTQTLEASSSEWSDDCSIDRFITDTQLNTKLGEHWANVGAAEHASVGSFLRFGLHLLSIGAPPFLLTLVHEASLDEIKHAQMTYGLAGAYFGYDVGPSKLNISNSLDNNSLLHILMSVIEEGCVGETVSAVEAKMASPLALDPKVTEVLYTIAKDEAKHAHLAWQFLAWAVTSSSLENAHSIVEQSFAIFLSPTPLLHTPIVVSQHERDVRRHGVLTADDRRQIRIATINTVIRPALVAVLAGEDANVGKRIASMELKLVV